MSKERNQWSYLLVILILILQVKAYSGKHLFLIFVNSPNKDDVCVVGFSNTQKIAEFKPMQIKPLRKEGRRTINSGIGINDYIYIS